MLKALRTLGIAAWVGCIMTLTGQAVTWVFTGAWPPLTLLDVADTLDVSVGSPLRSLPMEYMIKGFYVLTTTELSLSLWWLGVLCFALAMIWRVFTK